MASELFAPLSYQTQQPMRTGIVAVLGGVTALLQIPVFLGRYSILYQCGRLLPAGAEMGSRMLAWPLNLAIVLLPSAVAAICGAVLLFQGRRDRAGWLLGWGLLANAGMWFVMRVLTGLMSDIPFRVEFWH